MNVFDCFVTSLILGIFVTICAFFTYHPIIKPRESEISALKRLLLYLVRTAHYFVAVFIFIYAFFVETVLLYDLTVMVFVIAIYLHWQLFDGCILSIFERNLLNFTHEINTPCYLEVFRISPEIVQTINSNIWIPFTILALRVGYELYKKYKHPIVTTNISIPTNIDEIAE